MNQQERIMGPGLYHSCGRFIGLDFFDGTQVRLQHQGPPYVYYPDDPNDAAFRYASDEWMTFQMGVTIGTWNTASSRVRLWVAREGQPSVLVFDTDISHPGGFTLYNNPGSGGGRCGATGLEGVAVLALVWAWRRRIDHR